MIVLGLSGALGHDAAAAILVDGEVVAAAEEASFLGEHHAPGRMPIEAARYCLTAAGVSAKAIDIVAFPFAHVPITSPARWHYARRHWRSPGHAVRALLDGNRAFRDVRERVLSAGESLGVNFARARLVPVEHHLAHASSAYHFSGFAAKTAILTIDRCGEFTTTLAAYGERGRIHKLAEWYAPDSLAGLFGAFTEYLGFTQNDGEPDVMAMAHHGDPERFDLSRLVRRSSGDFRIDTRYANAIGGRRYTGLEREVSFGTALVDWLGPPRAVDSPDEPYVHYAAALQALFEATCLDVVDAHLKPILDETGSLAVAGGGARNGELNRRLLARSDVRAMYVPSAAGDAGTALGAAGFVAAALGEPPGTLRHAYLGPAFTTRQCIEALEAYLHRPHWRPLRDVPGETARLLAAGHPVAWFQGRLEFGQTPLGARGILGCPSVPGIVKRLALHAPVDRWRDPVLSMLDRAAPQLIGEAAVAPFASTSVPLAAAGRRRIADEHIEKVHVHRVGADAHPRFVALLDALELATGDGVVLNEPYALGRGPLVNSPKDALDLFYGSSLDHLVMEDILVTKGDG